MSVKITNNSKQALSDFHDAMLRALTKIGLTAEGYAKQTITSAKAIDTGRLRNSITWAISGQSANIASYQGIHGEPGTPYSGTAPSKDKYAVFVGTNVEYAQGIETGSRRRAGAVHFLRDAATQHTDEYNTIVKKELKQG